MPPDAPIPGVYRAEAILDDADGLRKTMSRALIKANEPASKNAPAMAS